MQKQHVTFDEVLQAVEKLSLEDKIRLVELLKAEVHPDSSFEQRRARRSLLGIAAHLGPAPTEEDIAEVRREVWSSQC